MTECGPNKEVGLIAKMSLGQLILNLPFPLKLSTWYKFHSHIIYKKRPNILDQITGYGVMISNIKKEAYLTIVHSKFLSLRYCFYKHEELQFLFLNASLLQIK